MSKQVQAEMSQKEAEGTVARGLAELPGVVSVHYQEDHGRWYTVIVHDYDKDVDDVEVVVRQIISFGCQVPHLFLDPMILSVSEAAQGSPTAGMKMIYERK